MKLISLFYNLKDSLLSFWTKDMTCMAIKHREGIPADAGRNRQVLQIGNTSIRTGRDLLVILSLNLIFAFMPAAIDRIEPEPA